jgi:hypothetical protein
MADRIDVAKYELLGQQMVDRRNGIGITMAKGIRPVDEATSPEKPSYYRGKHHATALGSDNGPRFGTHELVRQVDVVAPELYAVKPTLSNFRMRACRRSEKRAV